MLGVGADTGEPEKRRQKSSRSVGGIPPPTPPPPPDFSHFGMTCELKHEPILERPVSQGFKPKG